MSRRIGWLLLLAWLMGLPMARPHVTASVLARPAARSTAAPASSGSAGLIPLPGGCIGGLPPGEEALVCCMFGYVLIDGQTVAGAKVTITNSANGHHVETWSAANPDSPQPYYRTSLNAAPLSAQVGDTITIVAEYSGHRRTVTHVVLAGGQQVDVVLPRNQPDDYVFERQIDRQAAAGKFNYATGVAVDGAGRVYVTDMYNARVQVFAGDGAFLQQWGMFGDQPGQFAGKFGEPRGFGVAVDSSGNVYVADTRNHRIQKFSNTGRYIAQWGTPVGPLGPFTPHGVAVDSSGNLYVTDIGNNRVLKFNSDGNLIGQPWGGPGSAPGQFSRPLGVAVDSSGNVYIADQANQRIQKFDSAGNYISRWGDPGSGLFTSPSGVAIDSSDNVYVTDIGTYHVLKFDSAGNPIGQPWGGSGSGPGQFNYPMGIAVDSDNNVYVADTDNHRIQKFTGAGGFLRTWGSQGSDEGQFNTPIEVTVDNGYLYVAESWNHRIQKLTDAGAYVTQWGGSVQGGEFNQPSDIAVGGAGDVYVADTLNHRIQKFTSDGAFLLKWGGPLSSTINGQFDGPSGVAVDSSGNVYVADTHNNRIQKFDSAGNYIRQWGGLGSGDGQFNYPVGIAVDSVDNVYVADTLNNRIQKFTSDGAFLLKWGGPLSGTTNGQFNGPHGVAVDSNDNVYVVDWGNHRIQKFTGTGTWLASWGSRGTGVGQFEEPQGVAVDDSGRVYIADTVNNRVQVFRPMTFARPIATIVQATPRNLIRGDPVELYGMGGDSDDTPAIVAYEWTLDGKVAPFATTAHATLATTTLSLGAHTLSLRVRDGENQWSDPQSITLTVAPPIDGARPQTWTFLLYLDGDNAGTAPYLDRDTPLGALYRLEYNSLPNPYVRVVALYDGPQPGDSFYAVQQPDGTFQQLPVNAANEVDMGNPQTLVDFVHWGRLQVSTTHTYLAIADHANGLDGIAWDTTSGGDYLDNAEIRWALGEITEQGTHPLDVLHVDGCLMGLIETAYQARIEARYLIASENLAWSAFAYDRYRDAVTSQTSPRDLAIAIADHYAARVDEDSNPYTIAALDIGKATEVTTRTNILADELLRYALASAEHRATLATLRTQVQTFDSNGNGAITDQDEYVDLRDWAELVQNSAQIADTAVHDAATALHDALAPLIIGEHHQNGSYGGQEVNLDGAQGVAIYYPRRQSARTYATYVQGGLMFPRDTHWDEYLAAALAGLPLGPATPAPMPVAPLPLRLKVYLPSIVR